MKEKIFERLSKRFTLKRVTREDRDSLIAFFQEAYNDQYNALLYTKTEQVIKRWDWYNIENPYIGGSGIPSWICLYKEKIIGHFATIPISLKFNDNYVKAAWGRDLIVTPSFRNYGIGPLLIHHVIQENKNLFVLLIAGLNDNVYTIYKKFDFLDLKFIPLYIKILNYEKCLQLFFKNIFLIKVFTPILKGLIFLKSGFKYRFKDEKFEFIRITEFSEEEDNFCRSTNVNFPILVERDKNFLNWRYIKQPHFDYTVVKVRSAGKMRGYIVLRIGQVRGLKTGNIVDLFCNPNDVQAQYALVHYAVKYFSKRGDIDIIKSNILNRDLDRSLRRMNFLKFPSNSRFMILSSHRDFNATLAQNSSNWFITLGDSDLDLS